MRAFMQNDDLLNNPTLTELLQLSTMSLATSGADGEPHVAPIYFAADNILQLYFFSDPKSQHSQDLEANPTAAAAVYPDCQSWQDIHGLQIRGTVLPVISELDWERAWEQYHLKFPFVNELKAIVAQNVFYSLKPSWIRLVDNREAFGFKREWTLD